MNRREALAALGALALLPPDLPATRPGAPPRNLPGAEGPDLGNLFPTLDWIARTVEPALSFVHPRWQSLEQWKATAREALLGHLAFDPPAPGAAAEVVGRESRDGFTLERVRLRPAADHVIPASVLVPAKRRGKLPAVVALHCHGGAYAWGSAKLVSTPDDAPALVEYRQRLYGGRPFAETLARAGFVVLVIDAFYFGERRLRPDTIPAAAVPAEGRDAFRSLASHPQGSAEQVAAQNRVAGAMETATNKALLAAGATWPGLLAWDDRRSVDYLRSRPEVDPERIGCAGLSLGGLRAAYLAGTDPRIRVTCVTAWMTRMDDLLPEHVRRHTWMAYTPGLQHSLDLPDVAALTAPGALLVQQCERDSLFPRQGMRAAVERIEAVYAKAGLPERFRGSFHDEPHSLAPHMQEETVEWLRRWL